MSRHNRWRGQCGVVGVASAASLLRENYQSSVTAPASGWPAAAPLRALACTCVLAAESLRAYAPGDDAVPPAAEPITEHEET